MHLLSGEKLFQLLAVLAKGAEHSSLGSVYSDRELYIKGLNFSIKFSLFSSALSLIISLQHGAYRLLLLL